MGFNYAAEKKRFDREWDKLRREYTEAGMETWSIQLMYEFDMELFRSQRTYETHTQPIPDEYDPAQYALFRKYVSSISTFDEECFVNRYAWIDTIDDQELAYKLSQLSVEDLELLTLYAIEGFSQSEIAKKMLCSQSVISRKLKRIKNLLK